jgi:hypothetical protein
MSYDQKYKEWVEKFTKESTGSGSDKIYQIYQGLPIIRVQISDNPQQYRYHSPLGRSKDLTKLQEKIDKRIKESKEKPVKTRKRDQVSDSVYYTRWQDCRRALMELKEREADMLAKVEEFQEKFDQMEKEVSDLRALAADLRNQLEAARAELNKK